MKNKKVLSKEEFINSMLQLSQRAVTKKEKKVWSNFEEKNATKVKYRW